MAFGIQYCPPNMTTGMASLVKFKGFRMLARNPECGMVKPRYGNRSVA